MSQNVSKTRIFILSLEFLWPSEAGGESLKDDDEHEVEDGLDVGVVDKVEERVELGLERVGAVVRRLLQGRDPIRLLLWDGEAQPALPRRDDELKPSSC